MLDIQRIRSDPDAYDGNLRRRRFAPDRALAAAALLEVDATRRKRLTELQRLRETRKTLAREIGVVRSSGKSAEKLEGEASALRGRIQEVEAAARQAEETLRSRLALVPNFLDDTVPEGEGESANLVVRREGKIPSFTFKAGDHVTLGEGLGLMDFSGAAHISGARFVVLRGALARMERALAAFMLDVHTSEFGYEEIAPPVLVRTQALFGTGQLPRFREDLYATADDLWLSPTAEVQLTNYAAAGGLVDVSSLPLRCVACTPCFRSEAGAAGRDTRGMIRQHQFTKVELVSVVVPEQGGGELRRMTACVESILKRLELPFRVVRLCSGDTGFAAAVTYDIEVWMAGQGAYREISSCSLCGDFQARRIGLRIRDGAGKGQHVYAHTLNGSGLAVGRTLVAVMEHYQREDGGIGVPEVLRPYMGGTLDISAGRGVA